tara:strand:- start:2891 stop:3175 length:285 start_codon:yes stop_codon:yes gene_type:complete
MLDTDSLKKQYKSFTIMDDEEFIKNTKDALHFACYVCWVKNLPTNRILSDEGLIHQLIHLLDKSTASYVDIKKLRQIFNNSLIISKKITNFPYK